MSWGHRSFDFSNSLEWRSAPAEGAEPPAAPYEPTGTASDRAQPPDI